MSKMPAFSQFHKLALKLIRVFFSATEIDIRLQLVIALLYFFRVLSGVMQSNDSCFFSSCVRRQFQVEPNVFIQRIEANRVKRNLRNSEAKSGTRRPTKKVSYTKGRSGYGEDSNQSLPALTREQRIPFEERIITEILKLHEDTVSLEAATQGQSANPAWSAARRKLVTASTLGDIKKSRSFKSFKGKLARTMNDGFSNKAMTHGLTKEVNAKVKFGLVFQKTVLDCGLILDTDILYLGASPDGFVVEDDAYLEIKCPYFSPSPKVVKPKSIVEAVEGKMGSIHKYLELKDQNLTLKKSHVYYTQIQTQIHVGKKQKGIFIVYLEIDDVFIDMHTETILRDDAHWNDLLLQLINFFHGCKLPNLIESRNKQNLLDWEPWVLNPSTMMLYSNEFMSEHGYLFVEDDPMSE